MRDYDVEFQEWIDAMCTARRHRSEILGRLRGGVVSTPRSRHFAAATERECTSAEARSRSKAQ